MDMLGMNFDDVDFLHIDKEKSCLVNNALVGKRDFRGEHLNQMQEKQKKAAAAKQDGNEMDAWADRKPQQLKRVPKFAIAAHGLVSQNSGSQKQQTPSQTLDQINPVQSCLYQDALVRAGNVSDEVFHLQLQCKGDCRSVSIRARKDHR